MKLLTANFYRDAHKQWRWNLKAKNGRIIADSGEGYTTRAGAKRATEHLKLVNFKDIRVRYV